jgi:hypothetical protein
MKYSIQKEIAKKFGLIVPKNMTVANTIKLIKKTKNKKS